ncbi:MAG: DUF3299 domain-containing protein [Bacteroidota bacterium]
MNRIVTCLIWLGLLPSVLFAQQNIDWVILADVRFEAKQSNTTGESYDEATFGEKVKAFAGQEVSIAGYIIPLDPLGLSFVLSRNPNATCFFCGGGGPETVIEINLKPAKIKAYKMDEWRSFKGVLQLNTSNIKHFTYVLKEAEES